jgi:hypothetical protein
MPVRRVQIHCFITDIPACLQALAEHQSTLISTDLTLTNIANSPPLEIVLRNAARLIDTISPESFRNLIDLSIDSSHLSHVNLAGPMFHHRITHPTPQNHMVTRSSKAAGHLGRQPAKSHFQESVPSWRFFHHRIEVVCFSSLATPLQSPSIVIIQVPN